MNKQQLLNELAAKTWVDSIVTEPELHETKPNGDKWYLVNVREVVGKAAIYRNIHFYVISEETPGEVAYYKEREPGASIVAAEISPL